MSTKTQQVGEYLSYKLQDLWAHIWFKLGATATIAVPTSFLGVDAVMIVVLFILFALDWLTAIIRTVRTGKQISSKRMADSITKFALYGIFLITSWLLTYIFPDYIKLHVWAVNFLLVNEVLSIFENIVESGVVLPKPIMEWVKKLMSARLVNPSDREDK